MARRSKACAALALDLQGADVVTIEGVAAPDGTLSPVQQAFNEHHGLQCGFCTPGMIMSATALLRDNPRPTEAEIRDYLEGNICRCTGYHNIVKAIMAASGQDVSAVAARMIASPRWLAGGLRIYGKMKGWGACPAATGAREMYDFEFAKPGTIAEAAAALKGEGAQALGGGQTLLPTMKQRLAAARAFW